MTTLYREIDALGGIGLSSDGESWNMGYTEALSDVLSVLAKRGFSEESDALRYEGCPSVIKAYDIIRKLNAQMSTQDIIYKKLSYGSLEKEAARLAFGVMGDAVDFLRCFTKGDDWNKP